MLTCKASVHLRPAAFCSTSRLVLASQFSVSCCAAASESNAGDEHGLPNWVPQWKGVRQPGAEEYKSPVKMVKNEFKSWRSSSMQVDGLVRVPRETDVLIIGGGLVGQAIAYFLKREHRRAIKVTIVERDPTHKISSSALSAASFRQQFSLPENIQLSLFTTEFLRKSKEHLAVEGLDPIDMGFHFVPYLFLAETDKGAATLEKNVRLQRELGASVALLPPDEIKKRFPWLVIDKVKVGSLGLENEGYFDPWLLMSALKMRNTAWGVRYVHGEVEGFEFGKGPGVRSENDPVHVNKAIVSDLSPDAENKGPHAMKFWRAIIASGAWSGQVASKLGIGQPNGPMECQTALPIEPRKRYCYVVHCPKGPGLNTPMVVDPNGVYFRREGYGGHYLLGGSPLRDEDEPPISDLTPDDTFFTEHLWPLMAARAPCFEECKLTSSWAGYYDMNPLDHNLIIGHHPYYKNIYFASGLSGHGVMHSLGVGRAMSELIYYDRYQTIDLSRFSFDRVVANQPLWEETML